MFPEIAEDLLFSIKFPPPGPAPRCVFLDQATIRLHYLNKQPQNPPHSIFRLINCSALAQDSTVRVFQFPETVPRYSAISWTEPMLPQVVPICTQDTTTYDAQSDKRLADRRASGDPRLVITPHEDAPEVTINLALLAHAARASLARKVYWLWLDILCILENVQEDVQWHLERRRKIFSDAEICIVLPAGLDEYATVEGWSNHVQRGGTILEVLHPNPGKVFVLHWWEFSDFARWGGFKHGNELRSLNLIMDSESSTFPSHQQLPTDDFVWICGLRSPTKDTPHVAISSLIALLRVALEGASFSCLELGTQRLGMSETIGPAYYRDEESAQASEHTKPENSAISIPDARLSPAQYNRRLGTLLIAMLCRPCVPRQGTGLAIAGVHELSVLANSALVPALTVSPNFPFYLAGALLKPGGPGTGDQTVQDKSVACGSSGERRDYIWLLKHLLLRYSPTGNTIFWILVLALIEEWKCLAYRVINKETVVKQGIIEELLPHYAPSLFTLEEERPFGKPLSELQLMDDDTVVLHLNDAFAVKVLSRDNQTITHEAADGTRWEEARSSPHTDHTHWMVYLGKIAPLVVQNAEVPSHGSSVFSAISTKTTEGNTLQGNLSYRALLVRSHAKDENDTCIDNWFRITGIGDSRAPRSPFPAQSPHRCSFQLRFRFEQEDTPRSNDTRGV